jgi:hypothetical protein
MTNSNVTLRDIMSVSEKTQKDISSLRKEINTRLDSHASRITTLERFQNMAMGVLVVLNVFFILAATFVWNKVTGKE